jgi:hypothetical protein
MGIDVEPDLPQPDLGNDPKVCQRPTLDGSVTSRRKTVAGQTQTRSWNGPINLWSTIWRRASPREELNIAFTANGVLANPNEKFPENALCVTCHKKITEHTLEMLEGCGRKQHRL